MKITLLVLFASVAPVIANQKYYDEQEQIRRLAETIDKEDQRQRQEAKERYDRKESGETTPKDTQRYGISGDSAKSSNDLLGAMIVGGAVLWIIWVIKAINKDS